MTPEELAALMLGDQTEGAQDTPVVIDKKPVAQTGSPANGSIHLGTETAEEFSDKTPLIIQSQINGSIVELRGVVSNVSLGWSSNWQEEVVYGRIDPIPTYSNTTRTCSITVQLITPAYASQIEKLALGQAKLEKLNVLANMCYPGYDFNVEKGGFSTGVLKSAPLVKFKYGTVITGKETAGEFSEMLLGYIKSMNVDFQSDGLFAVGVTPFGTTQKFFQKISVSLEFGILHTHNVGYGSDGTPAVNKYDDSGILESDTIKYPFNYGK